MVRTRGAGFTQRPECQQAEVCVRGPFWKACCLSPPPVVSRSAGVSCPDGADAYWVASESAVWSGDASQLPEGPSHGRVQDSGVPGPDPFPMPSKQARTSSPWGVNGTLRSLERGRGPRESSRPPLEKGGGLPLPRTHGVHPKRTTLQAQKGRGRLLCPSRRAVVALALGLAIRGCQVPRVHQEASGNRCQGDVGSPCRRGAGSKAQSLRISQPPARGCGRWARAPP